MTEIFLGGIDKVNVPPAANLLKQPKAIIDTELSQAVFTVISDMSPGERTVLLA